MSPASRFRPMASSRDPRLEGLLATLSARLGCSSETAVYVGADECEGICELADALVDAGLLLPAEPAGALICDGCEQNCAMPVVIAPASARQPGRAFIVCDKRDDIGRVSVQPPRLRRWMFSLPVLACALAKVLNTDQQPAQAGSGNTWCLGKAKVGSSTVQIALARSAENISTGTQLAILLTEPNNDDGRAPWVTLASGFSLCEGHLAARTDILSYTVLPHRVRKPLRTRQYVTTGVGPCLPIKRPAESKRLRAWYEQRVREFGKLGTQPSREDDYRDAMEKFGDGISHARMRMIRAELAPHWAKKGRRPAKPEKKKLEV
jgi:hypothetical protein